MTPRTQTRPLDDPKLWRRLIARTHPDAGGDHELFIWTGTMRDAVCGGELQVESKPRPEPRPNPRPSPRTPPADDKPRVPFEPGCNFAALTGRALRRAAVGDEYGRVLALLQDCWPLEDLTYEQDRGASYKRLAAIAHTWGMSKTERVGWYQVAKDLPLSDRHVGHILSKLKRRAA